jgi:cob(I)alamin adenosyltransferase
MRGMVHVYTGNGKGKTTAALGLALRAVGSGKKVFVAQFAKGMKYSELNSLAKIEAITIKQYGLDSFIIDKPKNKDIEAAEQGLKESAEALKAEEYDLVILDEANIAVYFELFSVESLLEIIEFRNHKIEVVVTGRYADKTLIDYADLVTEMKNIKHYYSKGIEARLGIEK